MKTLNLGPKVNMLLPFVLTHARKLATLIITILFYCSAFSQSFCASLQNQRVLLNWSTTEEKNVSHFVIERSTNGSDYNEAALLFTDGNADVLRSYQYRDAVPYNSPVWYYRLGIVDLDGKLTYSPVRMIQTTSLAKNQQELLTYPNPVLNELRITIPESWQNRPVTYELYDEAGRLLKQVANMNSSQTEVFNLKFFTSGSYLVRAFTNEERLVQRIIKR
jgi:hypothetical protein